MPRSSRSRFLPHLALLVFFPLPLLPLSGSRTAPATAQTSETVRLAKGYTDYRLGPEGIHLELPPGWEAEEVGPGSYRVTELSAYPGQEARVLIDFLPGEDADLERMALSAIEHNPAFSDRFLRFLSPYQLLGRPAVSLQYAARGLDGTTHRGLWVGQTLEDGRVLVVHLEVRPEDAFNGHLYTFRRMLRTAYQSQ